MLPVVLLLAVPLLAGLLLGFLVIVLLGGGCFHGDSLEVVDHRAAGQPTEQQCAGEQEHTDVAKPLEKRGYHVTLSLPTQRVG